MQEINDSDFEYELKAAHFINPHMFESKWRVKLYHLNNEGQWDDMGTGYVMIKKQVHFLLKQGEEFHMSMISEDNEEDVLFDFEIKETLDFNRQRGTILTWKTNPGEEDDDTAISFQEKEGVREVW